MDPINSNREQEELTAIRQTILDCENCFLQFYLMAQFNVHYLCWINQQTNNPQLYGEFIARKNILENTLRQQLRCLVPLRRPQQPATTTPTTRQSRSKHSNQGDQTTSPDNSGVTPTEPQLWQHTHGPRLTNSASKEESDLIFEQSVRLARLFARMVNVQIEYCQADDSRVPLQPVSVWVSVHNKANEPDWNRNGHRIKLDQESTKKERQLAIGVEYNQMANLFAIQIEVEYGDQTQPQTTRYQVEESEISGFKGYRFSHLLGQPQQQQQQQDYLEFSLSWDIDPASYRPLESDRGSSSGLLIGARLFIQRLPILLGRIDNYYWKFLSPLVNACVQQREDPELCLEVLAAGPQIALILDQCSVKQDLVPLVIECCRNWAPPIAVWTYERGVLVDYLLHNLFALHSSISTEQWAELFEWFKRLLVPVERCPVNLSLVLGATKLVQNYGQQINDELRQKLLDSLLELVMYRTAVKGEQGSEHLEQLIRAAIS